MEIAVCILTLNEENNISSCIKACKEEGFEEIHVIDSGSTDKTLELATKLGAQTYTFIQENKYSAALQRNWTIENIVTKANWLLFIDADEEPISGFKEELLKCLHSNIDADVIMIPLLYNLHGKKIKSMGYPNWHDRVVKKNVRFSAAVGEYVNSKNRKKCKGAVLDHYFNSNGMKRFVEKQARYADFIGEVTAKFLDGEQSEYFEKVGAMGKTKRIVAKLGLLRPFLRFIYLYVFRGGILEGRAGFIVACYMSIFEFLSAVATIEYERKKNNLKL
ncbi:glycosyltransferase family 2 protein [Hydrogenimonas cancrithermarum]|uniref:Beta 1,4 glucosyltransferase n=1 Tax=Hydrogenimonas cancrithermarum TaxID=2993563 RepID=A0ABN6WWC3_9BACT|nr:glycosyltransferase family 2 protein [Hydrogenimonas cancrithermarum]BDY13414.1 beta 1,4 glucosyltransferase [Hydrogenimonas cancrithermarum]